MKFSLFTPTYNRAHTLRRLYSSIINQDFKDFEWLIVDDGSTDETETLVNSFIAENKVKIRYHKQANQGKHIAINTALKLAKGEHLITIDSDDYITKNCLDVCLLLALKIDNKEDFSGFSFIHFSEQTPYDKEKYGKKEWTNHDSYKWEFSGEMQFVFKTKIAKQHPFPVFKGEKFCKESLFISPILKKYSFLYTDNVLAHGDYLEDGLTQNMYKKMLESPRYSMLHLKMRFSETREPAKKMELSKTFWDIAMKTGGGFWKNVCHFPFLWTMKVFSGKILKKLKK